MSEFSHRPLHSPGTELTEQYKLTSVDFWLNMSTRAERSGTASPSTSLRMCAASTSRGSLASKACSSCDITGLIDPGGRRRQEDKRYAVGNNSPCCWSCAFCADTHPLSLHSRGRKGESGNHPRCTSQLCCQTYSKRRTELITVDSSLQFRATWSALHPLSPRRSCQKSCGQHSTTSRYAFLSRDCIVCTKRNSTRSKLQQPNMNRNVTIGVSAAHISTLPSPPLES